MIVAVGCQMERSFDTSLIPGKWANGTEYWVFDDYGTGHVWDEGDDVTEAEAQQFTWSVNGSTLSITHYGEMGEQIPKSYTIRELTETTFSYADAYGKVYVLTKVQ